MYFLLCLDPSSVCFEISWLTGQDPSPHFRERISLVATEATPFALLPTHTEMSNFIPKGCIPISALTIPFRVTVICASFAMHCGDKMGHPMDVPGLGL